MRLMAIITMFVLVAAENCDSDLERFQVECLVYMHSGEPSTIIDPNNRCCDVIKRANLSCCCANLNRNMLGFPFRSSVTIQDLINWKKVLHCLNFCGRPLPVGTKCGNNIVPPGLHPRVEDRVSFQGVLDGKYDDL